jgi:hypothetical protein
MKPAMALLLSAMVSIWVALGDTRLANSARTAAEFIRDHRNSATNQVTFEGHWGFQYYMEAFGFRPFHYQSFHFIDGDLLVIPGNNTNASSPQSVPFESVEVEYSLKFPVNIGVTTTSPTLGAGFYSDVLGPVPYLFGPVPPEEYTIFRLQTSTSPNPQ